MNRIRRNGSTNKWRRTRLKVLERDNYICFYCGIPKATHVDHITPVSKAGSDELSNLISACQNCNLSKGSKSVQEFRRKQAEKMKKKYKQTDFFEQHKTPPTPAMSFSPKELKTPFEEPK
jgi:5-methylcytosine-specific restriction endonuclease McrA